MTNPYEMKSSKISRVVVGLLIFALAICLLMAISSASRGDLIRNSSLADRGGLMKDQDITDLRKNGWVCPDAKDWPKWWGGMGNNVKIEWPTSGGVQDGSFGRISGGVDGYLVGYGASPWDGNMVLTVWARGKGTLQTAILAYKLSSDRKQIIGGGGGAFVGDVKVDSEKWVRYRRLLVKPDYEISGHLIVQCPSGTVDFTNADLSPSDSALDLIVGEEEKLDGTGALIENLEYVKADAEFDTRRSAYMSAVDGFTKKAGIDRRLRADLKEQIDAVSPYVTTKGVSMVQTANYNQLIVLTRVLNALLSVKPVAMTPIKATEAPVSVAFKPGVRDARAGSVSITNIHSEKTRYVENETANTKATIVNKSANSVNGTLVAVMRVDLETCREIARASFTIAPGETKTWGFSYNVGPETYGRAIEVRFVDGSGKLLDSYQEYYGVAAEYFRIQQHSYMSGMKNWDGNYWSTYLNQTHYFAHEPTDFGVHPFDETDYLSGQVAYQVNWPTRNLQIANLHKAGIAVTFYQNSAFCGPMGFEEIRRHPEYVLYDANGQFQVDPIYGGYPNPMELASPIDAGPNRKIVKPYLDKTYHPYQHVMSNLAREDVIVYAATRVRDYGKLHNFDGIYWDGTLGVYTGRGYDGVMNVPSDKYDDFVRLNARNHRIYSEILKKDNPYFGTWFNGATAGVEYASRLGFKADMGSGAIPSDPKEDSMRAASGWKNVAILNEVQTLTGLAATPELSLAMLVRDRDNFTQKFGTNQVMGYLNFGAAFDEPGVTKWGWPTVNYFFSQLIATQTHLASFFLPSFNPSVQFETRYSSLIWSRDIKAVPPAEAEKLVRVTGTSDVWWKPLVYRRKTSDGYDLIVHFVRIPPTKKWDINWVDEPSPVSAAKVGIELQSGTLKKSIFLRRYELGEAQQPVQRDLTASINGGKATVSVPAFKYHCMIVFRVKTTDQRQTR